MEVGSRMEIGRKEMARISHHTSRLSLLMKDLIFVKTSAMEKLPLQQLTNMKKKIIPTVKSLSWHL